MQGAGLARAHKLGTTSRRWVHPSSCRLLQQQGGATPLPRLLWARQASNVPPRSLPGGWLRGRAHRHRQHRLLHCCTWPHTWTPGQSCLACRQGVAQEAALFPRPAPNWWRGSSRARCGVCCPACACRQAVCGLVRQHSVQRRAHSGCLAVGTQGQWSAFAVPDQAFEQQQQRSNPTSPAAQGGMCLGAPGQVDAWCSHHPRACAASTAHVWSCCRTGRRACKKRCRAMRPSPPARYRAAGGPHHPSSRLPQPGLCHASG